MATRAIPYHEALRSTRVLNGWTQEETARKLGLSLRGYQYQEHGEHVPPIDWVNETAAPVMGWDRIAFMIVNDGPEDSDKRAWFNPSILFTVRPGDLLLVPA